MDDYHLILVLSFGLALYVYKKTKGYFKARSWVLGSAKIISFKETEDFVPAALTLSKYYFPEIEYEYQYKDNTFISNNVSFEKQNIWEPDFDYWGMEIDKSSYFWSAWKEGCAIEVYINPTNPSESVVIRKINGKRKSHYLALSFASFLIFLAWVLLESLL